MWCGESEHCGGTSEHMGPPMTARRRLNSSAAGAHGIESAPACTSVGTIRPQRRGGTSMGTFGVNGCPFLE